MQILCRPIQGSAEASVVEITPTTSLQSEKPFDATTSEVADMTKQETPCVVCGMVPPLVTEEAKILPKPMQAAFAIPEACQNSDIKVAKLYQLLHALIQ